MIIYTIGFTKKTAEEFFSLLKKNEIELLLDVRLNNNTQLAGFTKADNLPYFLREIVGCKYMHDLTFAPTKALLDGYKKGDISWEQYTETYNKLLDSRSAFDKFKSKYKDFNKVCLLCSEATPEYCHRRLLAEKLESSDQSKSLNIVINHL